MNKAKVIAWQPLPEPYKESDLYIEARLLVIKNIASASCVDGKDADNIADLCDEIYSAIEIVKQCGVSEDMCEWKYTKEIMDNAEFKVGCNTNALKRGVVPNNFSYHDFKYCPYCGKKIKVVD